MENPSQQIRNEISILDNDTHFESVQVDRETALEDNKLTWSTGFTALVTKRANECESVEAMSL